ncbi:hypothetical protein HHK36_016313 [Tetracentron sinense]|uniref:Uncharacterized protein n=1 Tax=Tetracentron sinense TaxID=13715 RepID=A0A834YZF6_TETSI|nr:hypothetical protein HHK36_016313 [Tetracentron sinense]
MRCAAKAVGLGVIGGYRGAPSLGPLAERVVASRNPSISLLPILTSPPNELRNSTPLLSSPNGIPDPASSLQSPSWEINDWEFIGDEEQQHLLVFDQMGRTPRLVFGGVPTPDEAKEATSDLKDSLDKLYFSPSAANGGDSSATNQGYTLLEPSDSEHSETKACIPTESELVPRSEPKHVFRAFSLLHESHEVQDVVASLASDKSVWEAVMKNKEVVEFYKNMNKDENTFSAGTVGEKSSTNVCDEKSSGSLENGSMGFIQKIKVKVYALVGNMSQFLGSIFGNHAEEISSTDSTRKSKPTGTALMALAIAAIMVIMIKRS